MLTALLIVGIPFLVCAAGYYWGRKWAADPLTTGEKLLMHKLVALADKAFEEADTLRPPPTVKEDEYKLSPEEIAEGWSIKKVDGCWIKLLDINRVDLLEADLYEEDGETVYNKLDPEYLALIASLSEEEYETPTVRPIPTQD